MIKTQHDLKQLIYQKTKTITDEILFGSQTYLEFLYTILEGVTKRFQRKLKIVFKNENANATAYTNGDCIYINRNFYLSKNLDRKEKSNYYIGTLLHEAAHILFSDFTLKQACNKALINENRLFPLPENTPYLEQLNNWLVTNNGGATVAKAINEIDNAIEDGFVDYKIMQFVPGYGRCRAFVRSLMKKDLPSYEKVKESSKDPFSLIFFLVLRYAKFGDCSFEPESLKDDLVAKFFEIKPLIDKAVNTNDSLSRKREINNIFAHLFSLLQFPPNNQSQDQKNSDNSSSESSCGDGQEQSSNNDGQEKDNNASDYSSFGISDSGEQEDEEENDSNEQDDSEEMDATSIMQAINNAVNETPSELSEESEHINGQALTTSEIEQALEQNSTASHMDMENNASPMSVPEALIENTAREEIEKQQEIEIGKKLAEATKEISHDKGIHHGISSSSKRITLSEIDRNLYEQEHGELDAIAKRLAKNLKKEIKERQLGDKLNGMYMGKKIDSHSLYRQDKKIFAKDILPEDIPDMEISLLVDMSGSMRGDSLDAARKTAYITYRFCEMLNIPISITGHNTSGSSVNIYSFADSKSIDKKDEQRIFAMQAGGSNRDGYAVRYCLKELEKSTASTRFMMIISDGIPNHMSYNRDQGRADLQDAVATYRKKGIRTIVAGIASDAPYVKEIYTKGVSERKSAVFLDLTDLQRLPKTFVNIIKKELK